MLEKALAVLLLYTESTDCDVDSCWADSPKLNLVVGMEVWVGACKGPVCEDGEGFPHKKKAGGRFREVKKGVKCCGRVNIPTRTI